MIGSKKLSVCARYRHLVEFGIGEEGCVYDDLLVDGCIDGGNEPLYLESGTVTVVISL